MMHADISEELLLSIFSVASPLHDGAVIVRERRIEAAGMFSAAGRAVADARAVSERATARRWV